jgi:hypothetical protein
LADKVYGEKANFFGKVQFNLVFTVFQMFQAFVSNWNGTLIAGIDFAPSKSPRQLAGRL